LDRVLECTGSNKLVHLRTPSDNATKAANWGTAVHHWKQGGKFSLDESSEKTFRKKLEHTGDFRADLWPSTGIHEVSYAFNCETDQVERYIAVNQFDADSWRESHDDRWVTGTLDYENELLGSYWI